ncbi:hypothetical protein MCBG_05512 [Micromonospora sp. M42]|nr:hypothetical protein MCBG_05512 [Micromonospora sp. M42]
MPSSPFLATGPSTTRVRDRRADLLVTLAALALAFWVTSGMWRDPNSRAITVNSSDQALFEWLLAFGGHALTHGENPLYTTLINVPDGVNLAVNTSITVYAAVFAPLTYLIGPPATFLVILTLNLAATAVAWYWLLSRYLVRSRLAAGVGALFIAFCPAMVSHANAHLNWTAGWLVPLLIWGVFRLRRPGRAVTGGIVLGLLVAAAFSIAAEGLFFTALALGVFLAVWALHPARWPEARAALPRMAAGLGVTALVAGALLAYPLWLHFLGPQRFHGTGFDPLIHSEDIAAYGSYPRRSLAGWAGWGTSLAPNPTEENSFFGVPLLVLGLALLRAAVVARGPGVPGHPRGARGDRGGLRGAVVGADCEVERPPLRADAAVRGAGQPAGDQRGAAVPAGPCRRAGDRPAAGVRDRLAARPAAPAPRRRRGLGARVRRRAAAAGADATADQRPRTDPGVHHQWRLAALRPARRGADPAAADRRRVPGRAALAGVRAGPPAG